MFIVSKANPNDLCGLVLLGIDMEILCRLMGKASLFNVAFFLA